MELLGKIAIIAILSIKKLIFKCTKGDVVLYFLQKVCI